MSKDRDRTYIIFVGNDTADIRETLLELQNDKDRVITCTCISPVVFTTRSYMSIYKRGRLITTIYGYDSITNTLQKLKQI